MDSQTNDNVRFGDLLDAVGALSPEEQMTLVEIVAHRLAEQGRKRVAASVQEARVEFAEGRCRPVTVDELRNEILS